MFITEFVIVALLSVLCTGLDHGSNCDDCDGEGDYYDFGIDHKRVLAQEGTNARFNCTAMNGKRFYWFTEPYGSPMPYDMYNFFIGENSLLEENGTSARLYVEVDSNLKRHDLIIKDVKRSDAGVYVCISERGIGNMVHRELVVYDTLTCQEDRPHDNYMGENVFDIDQDSIGFSCRMNYRGNIQPQLEWSVDGKRLTGIQEPESGIVSSSLSLIATSKLDGAKVTCEAVFPGSSSKDTRTGICFTSETIQVKYAVLRNKMVNEWPGIEYTLDCNPPCSYEMETVNGTQRYAVSYATLTGVKWFYFNQSSGHSVETEVIRKSVVTIVGIVARLNCTASNDEPVYWKTKPYGSKIQREIYIGENRLVGDYGKSGRFSVEVNHSLKRYDLVIKDVKRSDAGVYFCIDQRGSGQEVQEELVVWDTLTCQVDQRQESYMGDNVFGLYQDTISVSCIMNYRGSIQPQFEWSAGGRKFLGTHGTESGITSSSLTLVAQSYLNGAGITCEAVIRDGSSEDTRTGAPIWTSGTIHVKYAMLKKEAVQECPGVENTLVCNPPCSYKLEITDGKQQCAVSYAHGTDVKWFYFYQSCVQGSGSGSPHTFAVTVSVPLFCLVLKFYSNEIR